MTTLEPGARLDFTHGLRERPRSTAFLARSPAATITDGFDVFVQLVIAAITTEPCPSSKDSSPMADGHGPRLRLQAAATGAAGSSWNGACPGSVKSGGSLAGKESAIALSSEPFR